MYSYSGQSTWHQIIAGTDIWQGKTIVNLVPPVSLALLAVRQENVLIVKIVVLCGPGEIIPRGHRRSQTHTFVDVAHSAYWEGPKPAFVQLSEVHLNYLRGSNQRYSGGGSRFVGRPQLPWANCGACTPYILSFPCVLPQI